MSDTTSAPTTLSLTRGVVHLASRTLRCPDGSEQRLTSQAASLLAYLAARPGQAVTRDELMEDVWGGRVSNSAVDVAVRRLRRAIEVDPSNPHHVLSAHGVGFVFQPVVDPLTSGPGDGLGSIAELLGVLRSSPGLYALHGPGGCGKTYQAARLAEAWPGPSFTCSAAELQGVGWLVGAVATLLGLGVRSREVEEVGQALRDRGDVLLVLDDVERLVESLAPVLRSWKEHAPGLRVLATTRVRFRLRDVASMSVPRLTTAEAAAIYVERARQVGVDLSADDPELVRLVAHVDHLPLALEIAAGWARSLGPGEVADALVHPRDLVDRDGDRPARHRSVDVVVRASCALLPARARHALAMLSVCAAPFDRRDAQAMLGWSLHEVLAVLEQLLDHALLGSAGPGKYRFHAGVRQVITDELEASEAEQVVERRARHRASLARSQQLDGVRLLLPDLLADLRWASRTGEAHEAAALASAVARLGPAQEMAALLLDVAEGAAAADAAQLLRSLAWVHLRTGRRDEAMACFERAAASAQEAGDDVELHRVEVGLGTASRLLGRPDEARAHLERASRCRDEGVRADALASLGAVQHELGDRMEAARSFAVAADAFRALGDRAREASARLNLAMTHDEAGRLSAAADGYRVARDLYKDAGEPRGVASSLLGLGRVQLIRSPDEAAATFRDALRIHRQARDPLREAEALCHLAAADRTLGRLRPARDHLEQGLERAQRAGDSRLEGIVWVNLGRVSLASGTLPSARRAGEAALRLGEEGGYPDVGAVAQLLLAEVRLLSDDALDVEAIESALSTLTLLGQREELTRGQALLVRVCRAQGLEEEARAALAAATAGIEQLGAHPDSEVGALVSQVRLASTDVRERRQPFVVSEGSGTTR